MSSICCIFVVSFVNVMESALSDGKLLELLSQIKMWSVFPHYGTSIYIHMCYLAEKLVNAILLVATKLR